MLSQAALTMKPGAPLKIARADDSVNVDTGAISFTLSSMGGGVPENVRLSNGELVSNRGAHTLSFVETAPPANPPETRGNWKRPIPGGATPIQLAAGKAEVSIEQQDGLSATILVRGW